MHKEPPPFASILRCIDVLPDLKCSPKLRSHVLEVSGVLKCQLAPRSDAAVLGSSAPAVQAMLHGSNIGADAVLGLGRG